MQHRPFVPGGKPYSFLLVASGLSCTTSTSFAATPFTVYRTAPGAAALGAAEPVGAAATVGVGVESCDALGREARETGDRFRDGNVRQLAKDGYAVTTHQFARPRCKLISI